MEIKILDHTRFFFIKLSSYGKRKYSRPLPVWSNFSTLHVDVLTKHFLQKVIRIKFPIFCVIFFLHKKLSENNRDEYFGNLA
jgi:hypothetical protein